MRLGFVVNHREDLEPRHTTTVLARAAHARGHDVYFLELLELAAFPDGHVGTEAIAVPPRRVRDDVAFLRAVQGPDADREPVSSADLDVLWLRYNPSECGLDEVWAARTGYVFAQLAMQRDVLVLDHPASLAVAEGKLYLQWFPEDVRPKTLVTRSTDRVREFYEACDGRIVLKLLDGYGGNDVFLVDRDVTNLASIAASLARRGYIVAQEYLPAAAEGDVRLFMMNGAPLVVDGRYAAIRRVSAPHDFRSNQTAGGRVVKADVDDAVLHAASLVGPRLKADGLFLVGLDVIGGKVVEINAISPGGLHSASRLEGVDFGAEVIRAVERKVEYKRRDPGVLDNRELATLEGGEVEG